MDAQAEARKRELLDECRVSPKIFDGVETRLENFMQPFVATLWRREQVEHATLFVSGLLSDLDHKNVESIAYRFGQDRMPLQWLRSTVPIHLKMVCVTIMVSCKNSAHSKK